MFKATTRQQPKPPTIKQNRKQAEPTGRASRVVIFPPGGFTAAGRDGDGVVDVVG